MSNSKLSKEQLHIIKLLFNHRAMRGSKLEERINSKFSQDSKKTILKFPKNSKRTIKRKKVGSKRQLCGAGKTNYKGMKKN